MSETQTRELFLLPFISLDYLKSLRLDNQDEIQLLNEPSLSDELFSDNPTTIKLYTHGILEHRLFTRQVWALKRSKHTKRYARRFLQLSGRHLASFKNFSLSDAAVPSCVWDLRGTTIISSTSSTGSAKANKLNILRISAGPYFEDPTEDIVLCFQTTDELARWTDWFQRVSRFGSLKYSYDMVACQALDRSCKGADLPGWLKPLTFLWPEQHWRGVSHQCLYPSVVGPEYVSSCSFSADVNVPPRANKIESEDCNIPTKTGNQENSKIEFSERPNFNEPDSKYLTLPTSSLALKSVPVSLKRNLFIELRIRISADAIQHWQKDHPNTSPSALPSFQVAVVVDFQSSFSVLRWSPTAEEDYLSISTFEIVFPILVLSKWKSKDKLLIHMYTSSEECYAVSLGAPSMSGISHDDRPASEPRRHKSDKGSFFYRGSLALPLTNIEMYCKPPNPKSTTQLFTKQFKNTNSKFSSLLLLNMSSPVVRPGTSKCPDTLIPSSLAALGKQPVTERMIVAPSLAKTEISHCAPEGLFFESDEKLAGILQNSNNLLKYSSDTPAGTSVLESILKNKTTASSFTGRMSMNVAVRCPIPLWHLIEHVDIDPTAPQDSALSLNYLMQEAKQIGKLTSRVGHISSTMTSLIEFRYFPLSAAILIFVTYVTFYLPEDLPIFLILVPLLIAGFVHAPQSSLWFVRAVLACPLLLYFSDIEHTLGLIDISTSLKSSKDDQGPSSSLPASAASSDSAAEASKSQKPGIRFLASSNRPQTSGQPADKVPFFFRLLGIIPSSSASRPYDYGTCMSPFLCLNQQETAGDSGSKPGLLTTSESLCSPFTLTGFKRILYWTLYGGLDLDLLVNLDTPGCEEFFTERSPDEQQSVSETTKENQELKFKDIEISKTEGDKEVKKFSGKSWKVMDKSLSCLKFVAEIVPVTKSIMEFYSLIKFVYSFILPEIIFDTKVLNKDRFVANKVASAILEIWVSPQPYYRTKAANVTVSGNSAMKRIGRKLKEADKLVAMEPKQFREDSSSRLKTATTSIGATNDKTESEMLTHQTSELADLGESPIDAALRTGTSWLKKSETTLKSSRLTTAGLKLATKWGATLRTSDSSEPMATAESGDSRLSSSLDEKVVVGDHAETHKTLNASNSKSVNHHHLPHRHRPKVGGLDGEKEAEESGEHPAAQNNHRHHLSHLSRHPSPSSYKTIEDEVGLIEERTDGWLRTEQDEKDVEQFTASSLGLADEPVSKNRLTDKGVIKQQWTSWKDWGASWLGPQLPEDQLKDEMMNYETMQDNELDGDINKLIGFQYLKEMFPGGKEKEEEPEFGPAGGGAGLAAVYGIVKDMNSVLNLIVEIRKKIERYLDAETWTHEALSKVLLGALIIYLFAYKLYSWQFVVYMMILTRMRTEAHRYTWSQTIESIVCVRLLICGQQILSHSLPQDSEINVYNRKFLPFLTDRVAVAFPTIAPSVIRKSLAKSFDCSDSAAKIVSIAPDFHSGAVSISHRLGWLENLFQHTIFEPEALTTYQVNNAALEQIITNSVKGK